MVNGNILKLFLNAIREVNIPGNSSDNLEQVLESYKLILDNKFCFYDFDGYYVSDTDRTILSVHKVFFLNVSFIDLLKRKINGEKFSIDDFIWNDTEINGKTYYLTDMGKLGVVCNRVKKPVKGPSSVRRDGTAFRNCGTLLEHVEPFLISKGTLTNYTEQFQQNPVIENLPKEYFVSETSVQKNFVNKNFVFVRSNLIKNDPKLYKLFDLRNLIDPKVKFTENDLNTLLSYKTANYDPVIRKILQMQMSELKNLHTLQLNKILMANKWSSSSSPSVSPSVSPSPNVSVSPSPKKQTGFKPFFNWGRTKQQQAGKKKRTLKKKKTLKKKSLKKRK